MTDITTIDWQQKFIPAQEILAENRSLKQTNLLLISLTGIFIISAFVYIYRINNEDKKSEL